MASLEETFRVIFAENNLGLFDLDDMGDLKELIKSLSENEIFNLEDYRFAFVSNDTVDQDALSDFASGPLQRFFEVLFLLAEAVISDGPPVLCAPVPPPLKKARATHNVGGRLVFQSLEEHEMEKDKKFVPSGAFPFVCPCCCFSGGFKT